MREVLQTRNRAFGPNGMPTTSRQTSATRTDTTSRLPISLGSTNKRYEPSTHLRRAAIESARRGVMTSIFEPSFLTARLRTRFVARDQLLIVAHGGNNES